MQEEDTQLEATRARFSNVLKRHAELAERLSRCTAFSETITAVLTL
uniref:Uncharacterized protein n=1 Tax=Rhizophora mucronata TaxID=61149 RepID=A0A2P2KT63_RHIMU